MTNNYVDYKVEIWHRAFFSENADMKKVSEVAKKNLEDIFDEDLGFIEDDFIFETEYCVSPEENDNQSTIEVYEEDKEIWNNEVK